MKNKKLVSIIVVYVIILAALNVVFFFIPFPKTEAAWVCYGFSFFAVLLSGGISYLAFVKGKTLKSKIYGYPIFRLGVIYLSAQFAFSITILCLGFAFPVPAWIAVVVSFIDLVYVIIGVIACENARDFVEQQEQETIKNTKTMTYFRIDMSSIVDMCRDAELKKSLNKLLDDFRYSDPVSSSELEEIENNIKSEVKILQSLVETNDETAAEKVQLISKLLADRNRRCKAFKCQ